MKENVLHKSNNRGGVHYSKLWWCLALGALVFAFSCKQANNSGGHEPAISDEITITINGDEGVIVSKLNTIKVKKSLNLTWKDIKQKAVEKITTKENKEIKEWRIKDAKGAILQDADKFEKDVIVFAVSKDKEKPTPQTNPITITIETDEGYTFKEATKPCIIEAQKGSAWFSIKAKAEAKIELKDGYEKTGWKFGGKDGSYIEDTQVFNANALIFATSKKKGEPDKPKVTITVKGDEGVEVGSPNNFTADSGLKWASIKTQAEEKAKAKENFEIKEWHLNNAGGTLIKDETEFKENATIFAVSKRKVVQYKVEHVQENIENDEFTVKETEEKTGEAGKNTLAEAKQYEGFSCQGLAQVAIKADGSTVVQIKYKRNRISLILDLQGGKTTPALEDGEDGKKLLKGKFEAKVEVKGLEKENHGFEKWEPALPEKFPATSSSTIYTAKWTKDSITITVEGDENVVLGSPKTVSVAKGAKWAEIKTQAEEKAKAKENFEIKEWHLNNAGGTLITNEREFKEDTTVFAVSKERKKANYKVEHFQQNIENEEYTKKETEEKEGFVGDTTNVEPKQYPGFTPLEFKQKEIKANGSTVIRIRYKRNIVSLIIDLKGGETTTELQDGTGGKKLLSGKFESEVSIETPTKKGFLFDGWEPELPTNFPANDETVYTAKWGPKTAYRVTIEGDERVKVAEPQYIDVPIGSNKKIEDIKAEIIAKASLASGWSSEDYCFYDWRIGGEKGEGMQDATPINGDIVVYARTNYKRFRLSGTILTGYEGEKPRGRIFIPKNVVIIYYDAFKGCDGLTAVDLSGCTELTEIGYKAFLGCSKLKSVDLSGCAELTDIGESVFNGCTSLESIDLSPCVKLTRIGWGAFSGCSKLKSVNLSGCAELTEIEGTNWDNGAFQNCSSLESIDLSPCHKLIRIGRGAFSGCTKVVVKLPASITEVKEKAFGEDNKTYCQKVLVPTEKIKMMVIYSGYPGSAYPKDRIEMY